MRCRAPSTWKRGPTGRAIPCLLTVSTILSRKYRNTLHNERDQISEKDEGGRELVPVAAQSRFPNYSSPLNSCPRRRRVQNVKQVHLSDGQIFASHNDHSKWAVSSREEEPWVCIADINRMVRISRYQPIFCSHASPIHLHVLVLPNVPRESQITFRRSPLKYTSISLSLGKSIAIRMYRGTSAYPLRSGMVITTFDFNIRNFY